MGKYETYGNIVSSMKANSISGTMFPQLSKQGKTDSNKNVSAIIVFSSLLETLYIPLAQQTLTFLLHQYLLEV